MQIGRRGRALGRGSFELGRGRVAIVRVRLRGSQVRLLWRRGGALTVRLVVRDGRGRSAAGRATVPVRRYDAAATEWEIHPSVPDGFAVYGSFYELFDGRFDTEYDAMREARKRLRRHDRALERRLEFDHESDGTGVYAQTREDLEAMLAILRGDP